MTFNRKNCPMRHENGNCTVIGGFCTSVNDEICEGLNNAYEAGKRDTIDTIRNALIIAEASEVEANK